MNWLIVLLAVIVLLFIAFISVVIFSLPKRVRCNFRDKHVFITGGSKGIGKQLAIDSIRRGCRAITIAARNKGSLEEAAEELTTLCSNSQTVRWFQMDVSRSYEEISDIVHAAVKEQGPVDVLINNAGVVIQGGFTDVDISAFESQLRTNYLSSVYTTRAVIGSMKERRSGHIGFVSSAAGQCAIWGYSAYSPSKFAIRGFAEALHMELLPYNIGVSVLFPPNTETDGFQEEKKGMPEEVREISHSAGIFSANEVAKTFIRNIEVGDFSTTVGLEGWMLGVLAAGAAPEPNATKSVVQIMLAGFLRGIMLIYIATFNDIVQRCHVKKTV